MSAVQGAPKRSALEKACGIRLRINDPRRAKRVANIVIAICHKAAPASGNGMSRRSLRLTHKAARMTQRAAVAKLKAS